MEMLYVSRGIYNFLDVKLGERREVEESGLVYKIRMLEKNSISCLISPYENEIDGMFYLRYNTDANYVLERFMQKIKPDGEFLKLIFSQLVQCISESGAYLINPNDIVVNPEYMFFSHTENKLRLVCVPGYESDINMQLKNFLEYIMRIFDHKDQVGVRYLYELYEKITGEDFSLYEYGKIQEEKLADIMGEMPGSRYDEGENNGRANSDRVNNGNGYSDRGKTGRKDVGNSPCDKEKADKPDNTVIISEEDEALNSRYIPVIVVFAIALVLLAKFIFGGRNLIWLVMSIGGLIVSAIWLMYVAGSVRDEHEIDESMTAYKRDMTKMSESSDGAKTGCGSNGKNIVKEEKYKEEKKPAETKNSGGESTYRLVPLNNGCLEPLSIKSEKKEISVGRGKKENDYRLSGSQISRIHARVYKRNSDLYLRDAGSTNGTFVNSVRLEENEERKLKRGDVVAFATEEFFVS
jgi:hypothetical protein